MNIIHLLVLYLKHNDSETAFSFRLKVEATQFGPIDRVVSDSGHQHQNVVFYIKGKTINNVQNLIVIPDDALCCSLNNFCP
jgi:hypothetical protein